MLPELESEGHDVHDFTQEELFDRAKDHSAVGASTPLPRRTCDRPEVRPT
jgi:hypothetical protein